MSPLLLLLPHHHKTFLRRVPYPLQPGSSGPPPIQQKTSLLLILLRGDRGTYEEMEEYQLIPLIQGRQRDSSVKRWEIL